MEPVFKQLTDYVAENKVELALSKLNSILAIAASEWLNDVILLQARLKKLRSDVRKGIVKSEDEAHRHAVILNSTLDLIREIRESPADYAAFVSIDRELDGAARARNLNLPVPVKDALYERLAAIKERGNRFRILWIDDQPANNHYEIEILRAVGFGVDTATAAAEARELLRAHRYDLLLSDISRGGQPTAGLDFHAQLIAADIDIPLVYYVGFVDRSRGVPPYAFGIAAAPDALLHLVADVVQRK